jgi:hypothetical protein
MPQILTTGDVILCPHGGSVSISSLQSQVSAGALVVRPGDVSTVAGCAFNVASVPHPCVIVEWQNPSTRCKAKSEAVLTTASIGICKAADQAPQGTAMIVKTQMRASAQ